MPYRKQLAASVNALLPEGEEYVTGLVAKVAPPQGWRTNPRIVVVSTQRVHVFVGRLFRTWRAQKLLVSLPPGEPITFRKSLLYYRVEVGDQQLNVGLFYKDLLDEVVEASRRVAERA